MRVATVIEAPPDSAARCSHSVVDVTTTRAGAPTEEDRIEIGFRHEFGLRADLDLIVPQPQGQPGHGVQELHLNEWAVYSPIREVESALGVTVYTICC